MNCLRRCLECDSATNYERKFMTEIANEKKITIYRTGEAIDFLKSWHGNKPFTLVAIIPDGNIEAKTFGSDKYNLAFGWINERQNKANLYFHVNVIEESIRNKKARDEDIVDVICLHVDIDHDNARNAIEKIIPKPTVVVWSGNGVQAYWKYSSAITNKEIAARKNYAMAKQLSGDKCHDVSRILRLPGTINLPDKRKKSKGRVPVLSYIITELTDWNRIYDANIFEEKEIAITKNGNGLPIKLCNIDELSEKVREYCKELIINGDDINNPRGSKKAKYPSRSESLFRVCNDLIRSGCSEEQLCGIIMNPAYKISESVLEKPNPYNYALRQANRAREIFSSEWAITEKNGKPKKCFENVLIAIRRLNLSVSYDMFRNRMTVHGITLQEFQGELNDKIITIFRSTILEKFGFDPSDRHVEDALKALCLENKFHPIKEYFSNLAWDGIPRVSRMLTDYFGADDTQLNIAISRLLMVAAVRRIVCPGVKFDTIVVLEGLQGTGKSTALLILAGDDNFCDQNVLGSDSKTLMEAIEGVWIFEICELEGMKRNDTAKLKAFASRTHDKARMAYARSSESRPRQNIFIGTTNEEHYLKDETGNRRFLPVRTGTIKLDALKQDRDQLWAEAVMLEAKGESINLPRALWSDASRIQEERMETDPWMDILQKNLNGELHHGFYRITSHDILTNILEIPSYLQKREHWSKLATLMKKLGWSGSKTITMKDGKKLKGYERPATVDELRNDKSKNNGGNGSNRNF